jgi:5-methylcytosine-specific restriction protein B
MQNWQATLKDFLLQSHSGDLKTSTYPKEYADLDIRIGFGMGTPARVPWIAFLAPGMQVSNGIYPVYLYYKDTSVLVLAYGVSETKESLQSWPAEILNSSNTISAYLDKDVPRYGDSFVFKAYKIEIQDDNVVYRYFDTDTIASNVNLESELNTIIEYYKKLVSA